LQNQLQQQAKLTSKLSIHTSNRLTISVFSASGCPGYRCMAFALCESSQKFPVVCSRPNNPGSCGCYSCMVQVSGSGLHTKISYDFYKSCAVTVARTVLCCTQTI